jgi:hypothetical protein
VIEATVGAMRTLGAEPSRMMAGVGPAISEARYEVGADVVAAARDHLGDADRFVRPARPDHWWFDLRGAAHSILIRAGLDRERISVAPIDTGAKGPFFSARAEGRCGRFALLARMRP